MCREKRFLRVKASACLFAVVLLAACGAPSPPKPQFTLRISLLRTLDHLPYFVMREQGLDREHGLQFTEDSASGGSAILKAIAAGSADVGYIGSVPALSGFEGGLIPGSFVPVAVASVADPEHPGVAVLTRREVNSWKDLEGQAIAVHAINSLNGVAIKGRLQQEGVRGTTFVEIPLANMGLAVAGGNVAAAAMSEPWVTQSLLRGDGKLLDWVIGGQPFERMEFTVIVFRAELHRNQPQAVKAFLRAHLQAVKWIAEKPDRARSVLAKILDLSPDVSQKVRLLRWPLDGRTDPAMLESMQPVLIGLGMLKAPVAARQLYDQTLLSEVLKEGS